MLYLKKTLIFIVFATSIMIVVKVNGILVDMEEKAGILSAPLIHISDVTLLDALRAGLLDQRLEIRDLIIAFGTVRMPCQQVLMRRAVGMTVQIEPDQLRVRLQIRADDGDQVFVSVERGVIVDGTDVHEDIDTFLLQRIVAGLVCYI